jgi:hypothetical protein
MVMAQPRNAIYVHFFWEPKPSFGSAFQPLCRGLYVYGGVGGAFVFFARDAMVLAINAHFCPTVVQDLSSIQALDSSCFTPFMERFAATGDMAIFTGTDDGILQRQ